MSAEVLPLAGAELFWFLDPKYNRFHAFTLEMGDLDSSSICGNASMYVVEDVPEHDSATRKGRGCFFCVSLAAVPE